MDLHGNLMEFGKYDNFISASVTLTSWTGICTNVIPKGSFSIYNVKHVVSTNTSSTIVSKGFATTVFKGMCRKWILMTWFTVLSVWRRD